MDMALGNTDTVVQGMEVVEDGQTVAEDGQQVAVGIGVEAGVLAVMAQREAMAAEVTQIMVAQAMALAVVDTDPIGGEALGLLRIPLLATEEDILGQELEATLAARVMTQVEDMEHGGDKATPLIPMVQVQGKKERMPEVQEVMATLQGTHTTELLVRMGIRTVNLKGMMVDRHTVEPEQPQAHHLIVGSPRVHMALQAGLQMRTAMVPIGRHGPVTSQIPTRF